MTLSDHIYDSAMTGSITRDFYRAMLMNADA